ncbi:hypothetical protein OsI_01837 [Oryza sativa Indica Group]|uniref:Uncharacterized protein n=1 Tax=Oryza sativa subsp. indica TaxID=39946 RepID=A2WPQ7_ORYSI|nr:hypothetical protein OsI_01837 [Oryza sativa Indica Group]
MAAWRLRHSGIGGVLRQRRAAAATSSGVGKRRRRRIRWRSTELRDDVEMTHRRRAADAGVEEERGKRRGRKRGSASGLYQRLRCGRKTVTTTARLLAAARSNGGGGGFGKRGKKGRWPVVFIEEGVARVRAHDASFGKAAAPNLVARLAGFCGGRVGLRRGLGRRRLGPGTQRGGCRAEGSTWARGLASPGLQLKKETELEVEEGGGKRKRKKNKG